MAAGPITCISYIILRACCNPLVTLVYCNDTLGLTIGAVYLDDNGNCWQVEAYDGVACDTTY